MLEKNQVDLCNKSESYESQSIIAAILQHINR